MKKVKVKVIGLAGDDPTTVKILRQAKDVKKIDKVFLIDEKEVSKSPYVCKSDLEKKLKSGEIHLDADWDFDCWKPFWICNLSARRTSYTFLKERDSKALMYITDFYDSGVIYAPASRKLITVDNCNRRRRNHQNKDIYQKKTHNDGNDSVNQEESCVLRLRI